MAVDKWNDFLCEPDDRRFQPDLFGHLVDVQPDLTRIAVPEALLRMLLIIVNAQPDLQSADNNMKPQRRWEFESTQGGAFFWTDDRGGFDFGDSDYIGDEALTTSAALRSGLSLPSEDERGLLALDINEMGMNEMGMNEMGMKKTDGLSVNEVGVNDMGSEQASFLSVQ
ncbi:hypothetical protein MMC08_007291 [Hypocenomyce scalaris]|nr:hypothetical protein [Hypocenomyce scalaris]